MTQCEDERQPGCPGGSDRYPTGDEQIKCLRRQRVLHDFVDVLDVEPIENGALLVSSPFRLPSGEMFPVVVEPTPGGLRVTDSGDAPAHLDLTEVNAAEADELRAIAESGRLHLDDTLVLGAELDDLPTPAGRARLVQAQARMRLRGHDIAAR